MGEAQTLLLSVLLLALLVFQHAAHARERTAWSLERNALIERLCPGSTPQPPPEGREWVLGDDAREWRLGMPEEERVANG